MQSSEVTDRPRPLPFRAEPVARAAAGAGVLGFALTRLHPWAVATLPALPLDILTSTWAALLHGAFLAGVLLLLGRAPARRLAALAVLLPVLAWLWVP